MSFNWSVCIPLVGGFPLGVEKYTGKKPDWISTYPGFSYHDSHYINHLQKNGWSGDIYDMSKESSVGSRPDVVISVCPCAGLSSLSVSSGSDKEHNDWMIKSSDWVLENSRPEILIGENAPRLASASGEGVKNRLLEIARKHGYGLSLYKTKSEHHGSNQIRSRCYFAFVRGSAAKFKKFRKEQFIFEDEVFTGTHSDDKMDFPINTNNVFEDPWIRNALEIEGLSGLQELYERCGTSRNLKGLAIDSIDKSINFMEKNSFHKIKDRLIKDKVKMESGGGLWLHGFPTIINTTINKSYGTFVAGLSENMINHKEDRFITYREAIRSMGMPDNFDLLDFKDVNILSQNVCVEVAENMAEACEDVLNGIGRTNYEEYTTNNNKLDKEYEDLGLI